MSIGGNWLFLAVILNLTVGFMVGQRTANKTIKAKAVRYVILISLYTGILSVVNVFV